MLVRRILLLYLFTFLPLLSFAQVGEYRTDFAVGVNGGYMLSNVGFQPSVPQKMLGGFTGGITLRYTCEKYFKSVCAIVAEVNIAQAGWKEKILDSKTSLSIMRTMPPILCNMSVMLPIYRFPSWPVWDGVGNVVACRVLFR